jgi:hypothetical protein
LSALAADDSRRAALARAGLERVAAFDVDTVAAAYQQLVEELAPA